MNFPHNGYIRFLISRHKDAEEIAADLRTWDLPCPGLEELAVQVASAAVPMLPAGTLRKADLAMRRWLQKESILPLWESPRLLRGCYEILRFPLVRLEIELGLLRQLPLEDVLDSSRDVCPFLLDLATVKAFQQTFWDVSVMSLGDWDRYLFARRNPALRDAVDVLKDRAGRSGETQEDVDELGVMHAVASLSVRKMRELSREAGNGQAAIAMAQLGRLALDTMEAVRERKKDDAVAAAENDNDVVALWHRQMQLVKTEADDFASYDEIMGRAHKLTGVDSGA